MSITFAIALGLGPIEVAAILISGISFIVMFGIASAKGDFEGIVKTTLDNDKAQRKKNN